MWKEWRRHSSEWFLTSPHLISFIASSSSAHMRTASPVQGVISGTTCPLEDCTGVELQPQKSQAVDDKPHFCWSLCRRHTTNYSCYVNVELTAEALTSGTPLVTIPPKPTTTTTSCSTTQSAFFTELSLLGMQPCHRANECYLIKLCLMWVATAISYMNTWTRWIQNSYNNSSLKTRDEIRAPLFLLHILNTEDEKLLD